MKNRAPTERPALDLMEEAVHLLRSAPAPVFGWYLLGALPFLLGLLYFWTDMSWSALAGRHRAEASLGMALLFLWMKTNQAIFAGKLHARLQRGAEEGVTLRRFCRIALFQAVVQPSKLLALPLAALATIPFAWVLSFYENVSVLGTGEGVRRLVARAWRLARFSPRQNHFALSIYLLLWFVVFLNVAVAVVLLPQLLKMLTGVESVFTRNEAGLFNTTFFAVVGTLTYLVCNPLLKAISALRCFYAESIHSGADLVAELRTLQRPAVARAVALCVFCLLPLSVALPAPAPPPAAQRTQELDWAIDRTLQRSEFTWKLPRQPETKARSQWPLVESIERAFKAANRAMQRAWKKIEAWLDKIFAQRQPPSGRSASGAWHASSRLWMFALLGLLVVGAGLLFVQTIRRWRARERPAPAAAPRPAIDLEDAALTADALPEDEWLNLARAHLGKGELRLALRAYFLSGLAHLAARDVLSLARHKSNRDYQAELRRKARDRPPVLEAFARNTATVERVWYGRHEIGPEEVRDFETNLEQIRAC